jgi:hypothetical protein
MAQAVIREPTTKAAAPTPADELAALAGMVRRLRPDWRDAEGFYELRSEITGSLTRLARRLGYDRRPLAPCRRGSALPWPPEGATRRPALRRRRFAQEAVASPVARPKGHGRQGPLGRPRSRRWRYALPPRDGQPELL